MSDEMKPLKDEELDAIERRASEWVSIWDARGIQIRNPPAADVLRLVAEVRRLRAMIERDLDHSVIGANVREQIELRSRGWGGPCDHGCGDPPAHREDCPRLAMERWYLETHPAP